MAASGSFDKTLKTWDIPTDRDALELSMGVDNPLQQQQQGHAPPFGYEDV